MSEMYKEVDFSKLDAGEQALTIELQVVPAGSSFWIWVLIVVLSVGGCIRSLIDHKHSAQITTLQQRIERIEQGAE